MSALSTVNFSGLAALLVLTLLWATALLWTLRGRLSRSESPVFVFAATAVLTLLERWAWIWLSLDFETYFPDGFVSSFGTNPVEFPTVLPVGALCAFLVLAAHGIALERNPEKSFNRRIFLVRSVTLASGAVAGLALSSALPPVLRFAAILILFLLGGAFLFGLMALLAKTSPSQTKKRSAASHFNSDGSPKVPFDTALEAQELADRLHAKDGAAMSVYRCATCRKFHVGRSSKP